ncbi:hypothetical protein TI39_contig89g00002 [Zymoseptoria brevis]|uniref:AMP-dependent synthetase/ligase domain-containing protein n=1 Tax=Zymoseptoria brevis TaxID=1047168 RepID=A0A0F4GY37_9PEZI|nr:hypothetical protein TI39_contig89g00002 [Zymoseptoria brevis]
MSTVKWSNSDQRPCRDTESSGLECRDGSREDLPSCDDSKVTSLLIFSPVIGQDGLYISHKLSHQPEDIHEPQEYASAVKRIAVGLKTAGLQPLDCVCLLSRNDIYYWALGDGVAAAGGIICPIASFAKVDKIRPKQVSPPSHIFLFDVQIPAPADSNQRHTLSHLLTSDEAAWHPPSQDSTSLQQPCVLLFSSGTTGHAKAVSLSQAALIARVNPHFKHGRHFPPGERTLHYIAQRHASSQSIHNYATTGAAGYTSPESKTYPQSFT